MEGGPERAGQGADTGERRAPAGNGRRHGGRQAGYDAFGSGPGGHSPAGRARRAAPGPVAVRPAGGDPARLRRRRARLSRPHGQADPGHHARRRAGLRLDPGRPRLREPRPQALSGKVRIGEAAGLCWRDDAGQLTVFGKGAKTRAALLPRTTWVLLAELRGEAAPDAPMFRSCRGWLDALQVHRVVKAAAKRASLPSEVSAHWLHHARASHALDRAAPILPRPGHASVATTGRYLRARPSDSLAKYLAG